MEEIVRTIATQLDPATAVLLVFAVVELRKLERALGAVKVEVAALRKDVQTAVPRMLTVPTAPIVPVSSNLKTGGTEHKGVH